MPRASLNLNSLLSARPPSVLASLYAMDKLKHAFEKVGHRRSASVDKHSKEASKAKDAKSPSSATPTSPPTPPPAETKKEEKEVKEETKVEAKEDAKEG